MENELKHYTFIKVMSDELDISLGTAVGPQFGMMPQEI